MDDIVQDYLSNRTFALEVLDVLEGNKKNATCHAKDAAANLINQGLVDEFIEGLTDEMD